MSAKAVMLAAAMRSLDGCQRGWFIERLQVADRSLADLDGGAIARAMAPARAAALAQANHRQSSCVLLDGIAG
jgi:hypothetical protein